MSKAGAVKEELPVKVFANQPAWLKWLSANHDRSAGVWVQLEKKSVREKCKNALTYADAVLGALAWGWIDGQSRGVDDACWQQRFTPRGARSVWAKLNCERVATLIAEGKMQPPGVVEVERAKRDGRWDAAYDPPSRAIVPADLTAAPKKSPRAVTFFATLNAANRYAIVWRVQTAKNPETRARRIAQFVVMLENRELVHPPVTAPKKTSAKEPTKKKAPAKTRPPVKKGVKETRRQNVTRCAATRREQQA